MTCSDFKDLLDALVDAELDPASREAAEKHVRSCAECARRREITLRIKRLVRQTVGRARAGDSLRSRLEERLRQPAGAGPPESPARSGQGKLVQLRTSRVGMAAAILVVATLGFFLLSPTSKIEHFAAAQEVRAAFLRSYDDAGRQAARPKDDAELRRIVREEIGVELEEIKIAGSEFLRAQPVSLAGHKAVRLDFRRADQPEDTAIISVFLLPMRIVEYSPPYLDELQADGHYCQRCIHYEGTIYCIRRDDLFVAAVSRLGQQSLASVVSVR